MQHGNKKTADGRGAGLGGLLAALAGAGAVIGLMDMEKDPMSTYVEGVRAIHPRTLDRIRTSTDFTADEKRVAELMFTERKRGTIEDHVLCLLFSLGDLVTKEPARAAECEAVVNAVASVQPNAVAAGRAITAGKPGQLVGRFFALDRVVRGAMNAEPAKVEAREGEDDPADCGCPMCALGRVLGGN